VRLWCIHPCYLDGRGLVALWREGLLARKVLLGMTRGYRNHPQLSRFKSSADPINAIDNYLRSVYEEGVARGYHFDAAKIGISTQCPSIPVTNGQLAYEMGHLMKKLKSRDKARYQILLAVKKPEPHPLFRVVRGDIEHWERLV
jgi:hypothetical protein